MVNSASENTYSSLIRLKVPQPVSPLPKTFLERLVTELNNENVTALVLVGSYARGNAHYYSDVDILRFVQAPPARTQQRQYIYREGYLIGLSTRTIAQYRERFDIPEEAIFVIPSIRDARILLDKEGAFARLKQEAQNWMWEPLQAAANYYAGNVLMIQTEIVHKTLRALQLQDRLALSEMNMLLLSAITDAVAVQRGILTSSGNSYFYQVQASVGEHSNWANYHRCIAGIDTDTVFGTSLEGKGIAVLRLYQETARLLRHALHPEHREVIEQACVVIDAALPQEDIT